MLNILNKFVSFSLIFLCDVNILTRPSQDPEDRSKILPLLRYQGFPGSSAGKESGCSAGDPGLIPGLGRSPGGGHGNPLQYSCLENPPWTEEPDRLPSMG